MFCIRTCGSAPIPIPSGTWQASSSPRCLHCSLFVQNLVSRPRGALGLASCRRQQGSWTHSVAEPGAGDARRTARAGGGSSPAELDIDRPQPCQVVFGQGLKQAGKVLWQSCRLAAAGQARSPRRTVYSHCHGNATSVLLPACFPLSVFFSRKIKAETCFRAVWLLVETAIVVCRSPRSCPFVCSQLPLLPGPRCLRCLSTFSAFYLL